MLGNQANPDFAFLGALGALVVQPYFFRGFSSSSRKEDIILRPLMMAGRAWTNCWTCPPLFAWPKLKRSPCLASLGERPMAMRTWEGGAEPAAQAAPEETAKPLASRLWTRFSPSIPGKVIFSRP